MNDVEQLAARVAELEGELARANAALVKVGRVPLSQIPAEAVARFWAKVDKSAGPDACWMWTAASMRFHVTKRMATAPRRVAYALGVSGDVPPEVPMICREERCVNPAHIAKTDADKFWALVKKAEGDACWEWQGGIVKKRQYNGRGYGAFAPRTGEITPAHRYAWELVNGPFPEGMFACHRCDNPICCRPDHIFPGAHVDNMRDMIAKGRAAWQRRSTPTGSKAQ